MSCYISPITGKESVLAGLLEAQYGPVVRDRVMSYIYSDQFIETHEDFRSPVTSLPVDEVGKEPTFDWVRENVLKEESRNQLNSTESKIASEQPTETMYQLAKASLDKNIVELDNFLIDFLKTNFNVKFKEFDSLKERLGVNALGATDVLNKLIWYVKNRNEETLPEEAGHMILMLMGENHRDVRKLLANIKNWEGYQDVYNDYMGLYQNEEKVKLEAAAKVLAKSFVKNYKATDTGLDQSLLARILEKVKELIEKVSTIFSYSKHIADHIAINVLAGNSDYVYRVTNTNANVNAQKELANNPLVASLIQTFGGPNVKVAGSFAIAASGENVRRPEGAAVHDLDFAVNSFAEYENNIIPKLDRLNAVPAHYGWHKQDSTTYAFLIPKEGYRVKVVSRKNYRVQEYKVYDSNGVEVFPSAQNVMWVDFFVYKEGMKEQFTSDSIYSPGSLVYKGKLAMTSKSNPFFFNRDKDQEDFVLRNPMSFVPFQDTVFYQLEKEINLSLNSDGSPAPPPPPNTNNEAPLLAPPPPPSADPFAQTYKENGIEYRFSKDAAGIISGEYRQVGTEGWKDLVAARARDKAEKLMPKPEVKRVAPAPPPATPPPPVERVVTQPFTFARTAENFYEVSSKGDKRFSALYAKLKDGRTIEEAYQLDVKGYRVQGNDWKLGKGKKPLKELSVEQLYEEYKALWKQWTQENPELLEDLRQKAQGKVLTDQFASSPVSQARALADILNETAPKLNENLPGPPPPSTSKTVVFDTLPSKSATPTMTYAGIGSRETPSDILAKMTEVATRLQGKGYTLRSGAAKGADTAFETGVTDPSKKEIFEGLAETGPREKAVAHEIHPDLKGAMEGARKKGNAAGKNGDYSAKAVENLMARNTNQIFGKSLDTPVDFVLAYDPSGWNGSNGPRPKKGGTLQAIDMAARKGIPVINMADTNWEQQLEAVLEGKVAPTRIIPIELSLPNIKSEGDAEQIYTSIDTGITSKGLVRTPQVKLGPKEVWEAWDQFKKDNPDGAILAYRSNNPASERQPSFIIGNPMNWTEREGDRKQAGVDTTKEFIRFVLDPMSAPDGTGELSKNAIRDEFKRIQELMKSGVLKGKPIMYYEEKGYATHANAIDYLANAHDWSDTPQRVNKYDATPEQKAQMRKVLMDNFITPAQQNPDKQFRVGWKNPNASRIPDAYGYIQSDYVEMMADFKQSLGESFPKNLLFYPAFEFAMQNSSANRVRAMQDRIDRIESQAGLDFDPAEIAKMNEKLEIALTDANGNVVDFMGRRYGAKAQEILASTMLKSFLHIYNKVDGQAKAPYVMGKILLMAKSKAAKGPNEQLWTDIVNSFAYPGDDPKLCILDLLFEQLNLVGYRIEYADKKKLRDYFSKIKNDPSFVSADIDIKQTTTEQEVDERWSDSYEAYMEELVNLSDSIDIEDMKGEIIRDWQDSSFESSSESQATARLKMFIANQVDMEIFEIEAVEPGTAGALDVTNLVSLDPVKGTVQVSIQALRQMNNRKISHATIPASQLQAAIKSQYPRIPKANELKLPMSVNFKQLYDKCLEVLGSRPGLERNPKAAFAYMRLNGDPNLAELADRLEAEFERITQRPPFKDVQVSNKRMFYEFIKVMNLQYGEFFVGNITRREAGKGNKYAKGKIFKAQRNSQKQVIIRDWSQAQMMAPIMKLDADGNRIIDVEKARTHKEVIDILGRLSGVDAMPMAQAQLLVKQLEEVIAKASPEAQSFFSGIDLEALVMEEKDTTGLAAAQRPLQKKIVRELFKQHNIELNQKTLDDLAGYHFKNGKKVDKISYLLSKGSSMRSTWTGQFSVGEQGSPTGIFSAFFYRAAGALNDNTSTAEDPITVELEEMVTENNPIHTEPTTMSVLSGAAARHSDRLYSGVHKNLEGKAIWDYSLHTTLSRTVLDFATNYDGFTDKLKESVWGDNYYLNNKLIRSSISLGYLEGLKVDTKSGVVRKRMSDREQYVNSMLFFQNGGQNTFYHMTTHSDKTTTPVFKGIPKVLAVNKFTGEITPEIIVAFYSVFQGEYRRIANVQNQIKTKGTTGTSAMDKSGQKFFFFPNLNIDQLSEEERDLIWGKDGQISPFLDNKSDDVSADALDLIEKKIREYLEFNVAQTAKAWSNNGVNLDYMDPNYVKTIQLYGEGKPRKAVTVQDKAELVRRAAQDYTLNTMLWEMSSSALFMSDPANVEWKGTIEKSLAEYAKRKAKDIAPRQQLVFDKEEYQQLTIADVVMTFEYTSKFPSNVLKAEEAGNAQEFTTVREHLATIRHKLQDADYDRLLGIYESGQDFSPEDLALVLNNGGSSMNPVKPIYAGPRFRNGLIYYDYIKTSSIPLLPQLTRDLEIDKLRVYMETNKNNPGKDLVQRAVFVSGSKMGNHPDPVKLFDENGKFLELTPERRQQIDSNVRTLKRSYFGIQQEVPVDFEKTEVGVITQMDKNIVKDILNLGEVFTMPGVDRKLTGKEMRKMKEDIRIKAVKKKVEALYKRLGVVGDAPISTKKVLEMLLETAREQEFAPNDLALLEATLMESQNGNVVQAYPLFYHSAVEKFEKQLMSKVKKLVEFKLPGKSYVQVSSVGIVRQSQLTDAMKKGIVTVGDFNLESQLQHMQVDEATGVVTAAQVIMPFNFFTTDSKGNKVRAKLKDYLTADNKLDMTKVPKELLQMVAARIPNQGHNSMMPIEVVGFTPEWMGDAIIVPSAVTTQMGSDFDVDKLYTYQRPYRYNRRNGTFDILDETKQRPGIDAEEYQTFKETAEMRMLAEGHEPDSDYYQDRLDDYIIDEAMQAYRSIDFDDFPKHTARPGEESMRQLQKDYFDIHWSILTNSVMYSKIMSALDKDDLKVANEKFNPKKGKGQMHAFFNPISQIDLFQSGKDAKDLVGMTSLSSTFDGTLQSKKLRVSSYMQEFYPLILDGLNLTELSGEAISKGIESDPEDLKTWYSKHDNITIDQSGAVDNAKNRFLDNLNITMATYAAYDAMNKLFAKGVKVKGETINQGLSKMFMCAFSVQDCLKQYTERYRQENDSLTDDVTSAAEIRAKLIGELKKKYMDEAKKKMKVEQYADFVKQANNLANFELTEGALTQNFFKGLDRKQDAEFYLVQLKTLETFDLLSKYGERIRELQKTFNQDTNGAGPDLLYALQQQNNYNSIIDNFTKPDALFDGEGSLMEGQLEELFKATVPVAIRLLDSVFPVEAIESTIKSVAALSGKDIAQLSMKTKKSILRAIRSYHLSTSPAVSIDTRAERVRLLFDSANSLSLAKRVEALKLKYPSNPLLMRLAGKVATNTNRADLVTTLVLPGGTRLGENLVIQEFASLLSNPDEELRKLGEDLIIYSQIVSPQRSAQSIAGLVPSGFILGSNIASQLRMNLLMLRDQNAMPLGFIDQLVQHNPHFAPRLTTEFLKKKNSSMYTIEGRTEYPEILEIDLKDAEAVDTLRTAANIPATSQKALPNYYSFYSEIEGKFILYKKRSLDDNQGKLTYQRIDTLGVKDTVEYNGLVNDATKSVHPENKAWGDFSIQEVNHALVEEVAHAINTTTDPDNAFERWRLTDGGIDSLRVGLQQMSTDPEVPVAMRTLAEAMATIPPALENLTAIDFEAKSFTIVVKPGKANVGGSYNPKTNVLTLSATSNRTEAANTLLHETVHYRTSRMLESLGWSTSEDLIRLSNPTFSKEELDAHFKSYYAKARETARKYPKMYQTASELDLLRLQALYQFQKQVEESGQNFEDFKKAFLGKYVKGEPVTEQEKLYYSLIDLHEFTTHILTYKELREFLNTVESTEEVSYFEKLVDKLLDFISQIIAEFGGRYNDKSILKDCLKLSYQLTNLNTNERVSYDNQRPATQVLIVDTSIEAARLVSNLQTQGVEVSAADKTTHFEVNIVNYSLRTAAPFTGGTKLLEQGVNRLARQLQAIDNAISRPIVTDADKVRRGTLKLLYTEAEKDLETLKAAKDERQMLEVAAKQLQWVETLLQRPNAHIQEIKVAWDILATWSDLSKTFSPQYTPSDEVKALVLKLEGTGVGLTHMLNRQSVQSVGAEGERVTGIKITDKDLSSIMDISGIAKEVIAWERDRNKISQMLTTFAQYQKQTAQAEFRQLVQKLKRFKELVPPSEYKKFIQTNKAGSVFGLVQQLDPSWYQSSAAARTVLSKALFQHNQRTKEDWDKIGVGMGLSGYEAKVHMFKHDLKAYWKSNEARGYVLRTDKLLNPDTGELLDTPEVKAKIQRMIDKSGNNEAMVMGIIKKAQADYMRYLEIREAKHFEIDSDPSMSDAQKSMLKQEFDYYNSPMSFLNTQYTEDPSMPNSTFLHSGRFKAWFIPFANDENFDPQFGAISKDAKLKEGYDILVELSEKYRSYLPPTIAEGLHENFLPIIHPQMVAESMGLIKKIKSTSIGQTLYKGISVTREEALRAQENEIPIDYVGKAPKVRDDKGKATAKIDMDKVSTDLPRLFEMFGDMAIHYHTMYPVNEMLDVSRRMLLEENRNRVTEGKPLINNLIQTLDQYQKAMVFKQTKDLEGIASSPRYSLSQSKHKRLKAEVIKLMDEVKKLHLKAAQESVDIYTDKDHPYAVKMREMEERIQEITAGARYVAGSKATDVLIRAQQIKSMAYNPFSAVSNLSFGYMASFIHARGFRAGEDGFTKGDYTAAQLRKAYSMMRGNVANSWLKAFGYSHSDLSHKISALIERSGAIEAFIDTQYGGSNLTDTKSNLGKFLDPTAAQKSGDWLTKGAVIVARALNTPVEVMVNGELKTVSLFDALNTEAEWDSKKYGENKEWSSENAADQKSWNKFLLRTRMVMTLVFGNQDKNMPLNARRHWWGRLLGQFRLSWLPEGINTRWGGYQGYNEILERELEGRYRTMLRMRGLGVPLLLKQALSVFGGSDPFAGEVVQEFDKARNIYVEREMKDFEKENMRRNLAGLAYTALLAAMYYTLKSLVPDEEELRKLRKRGENPATSLRIAANVAYRSYQDLILYASPGMFEQITGSIVPSYGVLSDVMKAGASWKRIATDDKYEWEDHWLKQTKALPYFNLINKWMFYSNRDLSAAVR